MATVENSTKWMTIAEFEKLPHSDTPRELVRGRVVEMNVPKFGHGKIVIRLGRILDEFVEKNDLGHVTAGDSGVVTQRDPDTLRGADVAYYSFDRLARDADPYQYPDEPPEIVFEVRSQHDRWAKILEKVAEYLNAGVLRVCVLDPPTQTVRIYLPDMPETVLQFDDELTLPELHPEFSVPVSRLFP